MVVVIMGLFLFQHSMTFIYAMHCISFDYGFGIKQVLKLLPENYVVLRKRDKYWISLIKKYFLLVHFTLYD